MVNASEKLLRALNSDCADSLSQIIAEKQQEDFEALQELLSPEPSVNREQCVKAIYALGRWGNTSVVGDICHLLPNLDESGRISAVDSLGRLGTEEALAGILDCVNDTSPQVRKFVVRALGKIDNAASRAKLQEVAAQESVNYIREQAARYLKE